MRTCTKCGCYIPDLWNSCPACDKEETTIKSKVSPNNVYRVNVYYKDDSMGESFFGFYENALKYATRMSERWYDVQFVEVWDCQTHARLHLL